MDLRQLRYFVTIVEQGSFSKASAALNIAQPALSLHVRNMEADFGTALLLRSAQGVVATGAGEILLKNARLIIQQVATAQQEIQSSRVEPAGEVRLGFPGTISQIVSVPLILATRRLYPRIRLRIAEAMSGFVTDWLRTGRIDLAVLYLPVEHHGLASYPVLCEQLCVLGAANSAFEMPAGDASWISLAHISKLPLILPSASHGLRELLEREAASRGLELNIALDVDSYANIKQLVEKELGYSILPYSAISREVTENRLSVRQIDEQRLERQIHLVYPSDKPMSNAVSAVRALCQQTILNLGVTGEWVGVRPAN